MPVQGKVPVRKVCGITRVGDAVHSVLAGASAIGMVFYEPSPRSVDMSRAQAIADAVPDDIRRVGVFVNAEPGAIATKVGHLRLSVVQLHGDESPADCASVRRAVGPEVEVWKAARVGSGFDPDMLRDYEADAFLLDSKLRGTYGGTGKSFNWDLAARAKEIGKIVLAGGLDGNNVARAIERVRPWGVDASSRLDRRRRPGVKDLSEVSRFLSATL